jgi:hypothetical protein
MRLLGRLARWLGIYLLCNLITCLMLGLVYWLYVPKFDDEYAIRISRVAMQDSYSNDLFNASFKVQCALDKGQDDGREVTCAVVGSDGVASKRTYIYFGATAVGFENWVNGTRQQP